MCVKGVSDKLTFTLSSLNTHLSCCSFACLHCVWSLRHLSLFSVPGDWPFSVMTQYMRLAKSTYLFRVTAAFWKVQLYKYIHDKNHCVYRKVWEKNLSEVPQNIPLHIFRFVLYSLRIPKYTIAHYLIVQNNIAPYNISQLRRHKSTDSLSVTRVWFTTFASIKVRRIMELSTTRKGVDYLKENPHGICMQNKVDNMYF